ncbi:MAG: DUF721 domain-containing protein [Rhodocyclaceae bacterium]|nr:DUF721 domain-containing protein [Rhodocyclaceae bacterium]
MASSLDKLFGQAEALRALQVHAARLLRIEAELRSCLPAHLADTCHVANLRGEELVIHADSGAAAAKLRQAVPSLILRLAERGTLIQDIKVRVKPVEYGPPPPAPPVRSVSADARQAMDALADSLPSDSPVAAALRRLVRRAG